MTDRLETDRPAELTVFMSPACPHCAEAVATARKVAGEASDVSVRVVDAQKELDEAAIFAVQSVPTTILDGDLTWVGEVSADELREAIQARSDDGHAARSLRSLVESGRASEVAVRLLDGSAHHPFVEIWSKAATSTRIGLMMAAGEALESNPEALDRMVDDLLPLLGAGDGALRGDTADLLGQVGHPDAADALKALLDDPNPDVAEIAADALDDLRTRS